MKILYLWESYKEKIRKKKIFLSLKSKKKGVGSGSISQRYGSPGDPDQDPDQLQYVTDPEHCSKRTLAS